MGIARGWTNAREREGRARRVMPAREVYARMIESQLETGGPYMLFKDSCNAKSNHSHLGTIRCSNLCTEVVQFTSPDEVAVCNLGSLCLPAFVGDGRFDLQGLHAAAGRLAVALDRALALGAPPGLGGWSRRRRRARWWWQSHGH